MMYSCGDKPTVRLTHERKPAYEFEMCDKHKVDPEFAEGFTTEAIK